MKMQTIRERLLSRVKVERDVFRRGRILRILRQRYAVKFDLIRVVIISQK